MMFQHIKISKKLDLTPREQIVYALAAAYLSIPNFQCPYGGMKALLRKQSANGIETLSNIWQSLQRKGYLKILRAPIGRRAFRYRCELRPEPDFDTPAIYSYKMPEYQAYMQHPHPMFTAPRKQYYVISREMLVDSQLLFDAKWLWTVIYDQLDLFDKGVLTNADGAPLPYIRKCDLLAAAGLGKKQFETAWKNLKQAGYLHITRFFDSQYGVTRCEYTLTPQPVVDELTETKIDNRRREKLEQCLPAMQEHSIIEPLPEPATKKLDYAAVESVLKQNIQYEDMLRFVDVPQPDGFAYSRKELDRVVLLMINAICTLRDTLPVNGCPVPSQIVRERLLTMDCNHVMAAMRGMQQAELQTTIRNPHTYLLTVLYNTLDSNL